MKKLKSWISNYKLMVKPYWKYGKIYCISFAIWNAVYQPFNTMFQVFFLQVTINRLSNGDPFKMLLFTIVFFIGIKVIVSLISESLCYLYFFVKEEEIKIKINLEVYKKLSKLDYACFDDSDFFDEYTVSYVQYANKAGDAYRFLFLDALSLLTSVGVLSIYLLEASPLIVVITLISVLINLFTGKMRNRVNKEREDKLAFFARLSDYFSRMLSNRENAMDRKCTNIYHIIINKLINTGKSIIHIRKTFAKKDNKVAAVDTIVNGGVDFGIRIILCWIINIGQVGVGSFVAMLSASSSLSWKLQLISRSYENMDKVSIHGNRIRRFNERPMMIESFVDNENISDNKNQAAFDVEFKNVNFSYPNSGFSLKNINFKIKKGEKIAIVGENGGGKTTLTKLLLRLYDPNNGVILINGKPLKEYELNTYRNNVGVAFQETPIYAIPLCENISVYNAINNTELVTLFNDLSMNNILEKNNATFDSILTKEFDSNGIMLSSGEKQILSIARIYTKTFNLLILDEPSSALDPIMEEKISRLILDKAQKSTTILISHRLSTVVDADNIFVIHNGEIQESGRHRELMKNKGLYYEMFETQSKKYKDRIL